MGCQTSTKPPKSVFLCKKQKDGTYSWVKKTSGDVLKNSCEFTPPCGDLGIVEGGVWQCNKKVTSCKLTCPEYNPDEERIIKSNF